MTPPPPVGTIVESVDTVEGWLKRLPKTHALACRLIYIAGKPQEEVAILLGFSPSYLSRIHQQALSWLIDARTAALANQPPGASIQID